MNKEKADRFYTIYVLLITILVLGFAWIVFESRVIFAENSFSTANQVQELRLKSSLPESAKEIIDTIKNSANKPELRFENVNVQEV